MRVNFDECYPVNDTFILSNIDYSSTGKLKVK